MLGIKDIVTMVGFPEEDSASWNKRVDADMLERIEHDRTKIAGPPVRSIRALSAIFELRHILFWANDIWIRNRKWQSTPATFVFRCGKSAILLSAFCYIARSIKTVHNPISLCDQC